MLAETGVQDLHTPPSPEGDGGTDVVAVDTRFLAADTRFLAAGLF